jgi:protein gp37
MDKTGIIWTEKTWNPVTGCQKVSQGCKFCYAETISERMRGKAFPNGFGMTLRPHKINEPLKWKEPTIASVNSMSDLFWDKIPEDYLDKCFDVMRKAENHIFQVLTKRPQRMLNYSLKHDIPRNVWLGVTIESQKTLKERLPILKATKAETLFISAEPLLDDFDTDYDLNGISWIITGGESGHHLWKKEHQDKRGLVYYDYDIKKWIVKPDAVKWINNILEKSRQSGTAFFHKQWGGSYPEAAGRLLNGKTYNEIPLPKWFAKSKINNEYLQKIEQEKYKTLFA